MDSKVAKLATTVHTIFHELGHAFSGLAGTKKEDYNLVNSLTQLTTQDPSLSYASIAQANTNALKFHAFEEARADSVGFVLTNRTHLREYVSENLSLGGYSPLGGGFKTAYNDPRYKGHVEDLMREVGNRDIVSGMPEDIANQLFIENAAKSRSGALIDAHTTYHSTLSVPVAYSDKLKIEQAELIDETIERIKTSSDPGSILKYKTSLLNAAADNSAGVSLSPVIGSGSPAILGQTDNAATSEGFKHAANYLRSSSLDTVDRTNELIAQVSLSSESIISEISQDSAKAAKAVVSSSVDSALSAVGVPIVKPASRTSTRIIQRNANRL